jgi:NAD(P)-dependent dehydrogenase (short-subunit alcohol dehydrogenase family)
MLAMGMAWEWGPRGVRTNVVQPAWIETSWMAL